MAFYLANYANKGVGVVEASNARQAARIVVKSQGLNPNDNGNIAQVQVWHIRQELGEEIKLTQPERMLN